MRQHFGMRARFAIMQGAGPILTAEISRDERRWDHIRDPSIIKFHDFIYLANFES